MMKRGWVTNDEKRLLYLRAGHNVADICTLHRKVYYRVHFPV